MSQSVNDVSILIPAYKPEWFAQSLDSCLAQTAKVREILVSDDCPTDEIQRILASRLSDPRIRYIRNTPSLGLAANYLQLAREAKGRWFKFFDDDDIMHPDCVERLMQHAYDSVSLVIGGCRLLHEDGSITEKREPLPAFTGGTSYFLNTYPRIPLTLFSRMLIRGDVLHDLLTEQIPARMISLDELVGLRACLKGGVAYEPTLVCDHRNYPGGYSRTVDTEVLLADAAYVTNPHECALRMGLAPRPVLDKWHATMVRKYARGVITKYLQVQDHAGLFTFLARLRERFGLLAIGSAASPRLIARFFKNLFR